MVLFLSALASRADRDISIINPPPSALAAWTVPPCSRNVDTDVDGMVSEVDTDGDGLISKTKDEAFLAQMTDQINQSESSSTGTDSVAGSDQDWQNRIFTVLLKSMIAGYSVKDNATSVYA